MSKQWKPDISEAAASERRRRVVGSDADRSGRERLRALRGGAAPEPKEMFWVIGGGMALGLMIAFVPTWFHRSPGPDVHISRAEDRRLLAEANRVRLGDRTPAIAGDPSRSLIEPRTSDEAETTSGPDEPDQVAPAADSAPAPASGTTAPVGM